jgi:D-glycero-D-manno-heptose 1,7-bisphosphate phosphatase
MIKHVIFDRDGTLIEHIPYLKKVSDVKLLPKVKSCIKFLIDNGIAIHLHTNQSGISRGYFDLDDAKECNKKMIDLIGMGDDIFDSICISDDYPPKLNSYRKPSKKFGLELIKKHNIKKDNLCYIGDNITDLETAYNLGCLGFGVNTGLNNLYDLVKNSKMNFKVYNDIGNLFDKEFKNN